MRGTDLTPDRSYMLTGFSPVWLLFVIYFFSGNLNAQSDSAIVKDAGPSVLKRLGANAIKQNDPASAVVFLSASVSKNKDDADAIALLGKAYMLTRDYERAERTFLKAYKTDRSRVPEALYYHALMQKSNGKIDSARVNFQKFVKEYKGPEKILKKKANREILLCDSIKKLIVTDTRIVVKRLDTTINKVNTEASPINIDDSTMLFASLRTDKKEYIEEDEVGKEPKKKVYLAKRINGKWKFSGEFGNVFNDPDYNISSFALSPDGKRLYCSFCAFNAMERMVCALYLAEKKGSKWSEPKKLPKTVNNRRYSNTMPSVGTDPRTKSDMIFFVSERKSGKGGTDIWYTVYNKKRKTYKTPRNLGSKINTSDDEISPFFDNETRTLYFSSDGHSGLGGFDIFKATGDGNRWTGIENVGQPLNSGADDVYYSVSTSREEGFFVSNRKGGNALKNLTCCDDIYHYKRTEYIKITLKGNVSDALDEHAILSNANIDVYLRDKVTNEKFLVKTVKSDSLGNFMTSLEADQEYSVVVRKDDYLGTTENISTKGAKQKVIVTKQLKVVRKPKESVKIPNVQYAFDRWEVQESSKAYLDATVLSLMENNPELIIEIQSHTDSKGTEAYNLKLSQKRAESVVNYLISKGIAPDRLRAKGYGESQPVAPNQKPDGSDNPDGRAMNRRTDFKIIGIIDADLEIEGLDEEKK